MMPRVLPLYVGIAEHDIGENVTDLTKIIKSLAGPDVGDVT
jgi:hypothetical protein